MDETQAIVLQEKVQMGMIEFGGPKELLTRASLIATELKEIVVKKGLSKKIGGGEHIYVDAWTTLGALLGVTAREDTEHTKELESGDMQGAVLLVRNSDGTIIGGASAIVGMDEPNWAKKPRYARRSMAVTRATGKAFRITFSWIAVLAGYSPTPAEEMDFIEGEVRDASPKVPAPSEERPYPPEILKERLGQIAVYFKNKNAKATENQRDVLAAALDQATGSEENRHLLCNWLVGEPSTKKMPANVVHALLKWMEVESFTDKPVDMAVDEAIGALDFVNTGVD